MPGRAGTSTSVDGGPAEQQCGVPDCNFMFPDPGDDCNEGDCKKQCDSSDGAAATGLGFLTAAAAAVAAL